MLFFLALFFAFCYHFTMETTTQFIFPTFVFKGDGQATSNQISAYCSRWYYHATGNSTYINIVYLADVMPVYAVPNVRVYRVERTPSGFEFTEVFDAVDTFVGNRVSDAIPFDAIMDEAYWWEWIDWCALKTPDWFPTVNAAPPQSEPNKVQKLTPDGYVNTPIPEVAPANIFNPGGEFPGHPQFNPSNDDGKPWYYAGFSRCGYAFSYDAEPFNALYPNLEESADYGSYSGLGSVIGADAFGRFQTSAMMFGDDPFNGGVSDIYVIKTTMPLRPYDPISYYINHGAYYPQQGFLGDNTGEGFFPASFTLTSLTGGIRSFSVNEVRRVEVGSGHRLFERRSIFEGNKYILTDFLSPKKQGIVEYYTHHFYKPTKSLRDRLPFLPAFFPPVAPGMPGGVIPPMMGGLLGGMVTQNTQALLAQILNITGNAGRRDLKHGR